jgi:hypothetical protein
MDEKLGRYNYFILFTSSSTSYFPHSSFSSLKKKKISQIYSLGSDLVMWKGNATAFSWREDGEVVE